MTPTSESSEAARFDLSLPRLLAERARVMLGASALSVSVFTIADLLFRAHVSDLVLPIHVAQLATLTMGILLVTPDAKWRTSIAVLFATMVLEACAMTLLAGILADTSTTPLLLTVFALMAAVLLPWGWREQAAGAVVVAVASLASLQVVTGSLQAAMSYPGLALAVALIFSVLIVHTLDRFRRRSAIDRLALVQSEARFRELVQDVDAAVWEVELPSFDVAFLSRDFATDLGFPVRSRGDSLSDFLSRVHPEDRDGLVAVALGLAEGKGYEHEYRVVAGDGRSVWIHEKARVSFDIEGRPVRVRGISVNTTGLRRDREVLARRSSQVETVNAAMTVHVEKKPWTAAMVLLVAGAARATASEIGFALRADQGGSWRLFACHGVDARSQQGRALLREAVRRIVEERGQHELPTTGLLLEEEGGTTMPFEAESPPPIPVALATLLASPVVVDGRTVAFVVVGNRPASYGVDQEEDVAALATTVAVIHQAQAREAREAVLKKTRAQLVEILDASPDLVSTTDAKGRSIYTNPAGRRLLGIAADEDVSTLRFDQFLAPEAAVHFVDEIVPVAVKDGIWRGEIVARDRSGRDIPLAFVFLAHRDEEGRIRFFSSTGHDVSSDKQTAEQIRALNEELGRRVAERTRQLEEAMREMESFSYSVSHDLRAPLRRIDGFCALLDEELGDRLDERQRAYIDRVRQGAQGMGVLIDAQLNLARVSRAPIRRQTVDLSRLVESRLADLQQAEPDRRVTWRVEPGLVAEADLGLVTIALDNLVSNAWKYTRRRDAAHIEFGLLDRAADGGEADATAPPPAWFLRDNGAGFDMAYAKKLFGTFQRLHHEKEFEGTGVGLATVERIVRRHGGRVWAEAAPGRGATFYFTLEEAAAAPASPGAPASL